MKTENIKSVYPRWNRRNTAIAEDVNQNTEDIGARRLHTVLERLLENLMFEADQEEMHVAINRAYVEKELSSIVADRDLSRYIL